jgi:hypothetical protein
MFLFCTVLRPNILMDVLMLVDFRSLKSIILLSSHHVCDAVRV